jgi:hypothetical protein
MDFIKQTDRHDRPFTASIIVLRPDVEELLVIAPINLGALIAEIYQHPEVVKSKCDLF